MLPIATACNSNTSSEGAKSHMNRGDLGCVLVGATFCAAMQVADQYSRADFESAASASSAIPAKENPHQVSTRTSALLNGNERG
jgi:hypothetical protein